MYMANKIETSHPLRRRGYEPTRMHHIVCLLITALLCLIATSNTAGATETYYVDDANGNDSNLGTSSAPWKTLNRAYTWYSGTGTKVQEGDTVLFRDGNYGGFREHTNDGASYLFYRNNWITYKAQPGHSPTIASIAIQNLDKWGGAGNGDSYLHFEGFNITSGVTLGKTQYVKFIDCNITGGTVAGVSGFYEPYYTSSNGMAIYAETECNKITIQNCAIHACYRGITFRGDSWFIDNCVISDAAEDCISSNVNVSNMTIQDCEMIYAADNEYSSRGDVRGTANYNGGSGFTEGEVVIQAITGAEGVVTDDEDNGEGAGKSMYLYNTSETVFDTSNTITGQNSGATISSITDIDWVHPDGMQFQNAVGDSVVITRNRVNGTNRFGGIKLGGNSQALTGVVITNNQIYNTNDDSIYVTGAVVDTLASNTCTEQLRLFVSDGDVTITNMYNNFFKKLAFTDPTGNAMITNNNNNIWQENPNGIGTSNPYVLAANEQIIANWSSGLFTNYSGYDFTLTSGSAAIDAGHIGDGVPTIDHNGNSRVGTPDVGCYEYVDSNNQALVADAGTDQTRTDDDGNGSETVTLDGSGSNGQDGNIVSWVWTDDLGNTIPDGEITTATLSIGTHTITLTVTDDNGATDTDTVSIIVNSGNQAPSADAGVDQTRTDDDGNGSELVALNGSGSTDSDGHTVSWVWTDDLGNTIPDGEITTATLSIGTHTITLTVTDDDGATDTDTVIITVNAAADTTAPSVANCAPAVDSIQAPLNTLIILHVVDDGKGVDPESVTINVNGDPVYLDNTATHSSAHGKCHRIGTKANYTFIYQPKQNFEFDESVSVKVNAIDMASNTMEYSYSFKTEMRSIGENKKVSPSFAAGKVHARPSTDSDSKGDIWIAWDGGSAGSRDIYVGKVPAESTTISNTTQVTDNLADQCYPVIATGSDDMIYLAWQDNRNGDWDIYVSIFVDGGDNWSTEQKVVDSDANQINPAIVVDSSNNASIVWEDDRHGNQDIYIATLSNGFLTKAVSQITSDSFDQVEPAIAADSDNTVYVVWTDTRNSKKNVVNNDIYGAASNDGPWTNIPVVTEDDSQSKPAIATEAVGSILHLVWLDDRVGDDDIFYVKTDGGLPASPLTGSSIIDDGTGADQLDPVIAVTGSTDNNLRVFACWEDERDADDDLYFAEISLDYSAKISSGDKANVFVGDDGTNTDQTEPAIGIDGYGHPYLVWTNDKTDICYAGSTFIKPVALASEDVSISSKTTVGTMWSAIQSVDDASAEVPLGAYLCDVKMTVSRIKNPRKFTFDRFPGAFEFGPSGMEFTEPVTITIPYEVSGSENVSYTAYCYSPLTNTLSQQGITDVETIVISPTLHALRFKTTHFSQFIIGGVLGGLGGFFGGGGGCSMSPDSQAGIGELLLPYIGLTMAMVILKLRDRRKRETGNITKSEC